MLQNKAIKVIKGVKWRDRATPFYKKLKILKIVDVYKLETAIFMYKYSTNKLPAGMNNLFQETSQVHTKCTRNANQNKFRFTEQIAYKTQFNIRVLIYGTALIQKSEI